jgi:NAD(P)-dependent dehydrogenase (short-subunit alcohol dehydrogenase family)
MSERSAIVTGASRGIGKQIAIELGKLGYCVAVAARSVTPHARLAGSIGETVEAIQAAGGTALAVPTDLRDPEAIELLVQATADRFGGVDLLVNNAADTSGGVPGLSELEFDDWKRQFEINLDAPLRLMQAALPFLAKSQRALIVNLTSGAAEPVPLGEAVGVLGGERLAYAASKAALNRLANALAPELRARGVAIVNVDPGFTRTELVDRMVARGVVDAATSHPMSVPVELVMSVIKSDDPMALSGSVLRARA